jgi:membrane protease YdiL (CAAX protease family)
LTSIDTQTESSYPTVPWGARDVWLGLAVLGLSAAAIVPLAILGLSRSLELNPGLAISLGELILLVPVWLLAIRKYGVGWDAFGLGCGMVLLSLVFNLVYGLFLGLFGLRIQPDLAPLFAQLSSPWLLLIGGAIVAPVVEEIFFRGFVFAGLRPQYGWQRAAVISSALFSVIHLIPTAVIPIFILGYIFAYLYQRSGSIWPAIVMHAATNALALGGAYFLANSNLAG